MEQQEQRRKFVKNLHNICELIEYNKAFEDGLKRHPNSEYLEEIKKFKDVSAKKACILLEFTRGRNTCHEMIEILKNSGDKNARAATLLEEYNSSPKFMSQSEEVELHVTPSIELKSGHSKWFEMDGKPRGKCLIINNLKNQITKESLRFEYVFKQLFFDVELCYDMTAEEMENKLKGLAKEKRLSKDQALVVMIISHGYDEKVEGVDKKVLNVSSIVDIFSEENCKSLSRKPKLFFFNCCRHKTGNLPALAKHVPEQNKIIIEVENVGPAWKCANQYTMISFACAEGHDAWFNLTGFTFYGQALSHCIAQYACDKSIQSIMNLTDDRLAYFGSAEVRLFKMTRELFLNPGLTKKS